MLLQAPVSATKSYAKKSGISASFASLKPRFRVQSGAWRPQCEDLIEGAHFSEIAGGSAHAYTLNGKYHSNPR